MCCTGTFIGVSVFAGLDYGTGLLNSHNVMQKCNYDVMIGVCHLVLRKDCARFVAFVVRLQLQRQVRGCMMLMLLACLCKEAHHISRSDCWIVSCPVTDIWQTRCCPNVSVSNDRTLATRPNSSNFSYVPSAYPRVASLLAKANKMADICTGT